MMSYSETWEMTCDSDQEYVVQVDADGVCKLPQGLLLDAGINGARSMLFRNVSDREGNKHLLARPVSAFQARHSITLENLTMLASGNACPNVAFAVYSGTGKCLSRTSQFQSLCVTLENTIQSQVWELVRNPGQTYTSSNFTERSELEPRTVYIAAIRRQLGSHASGAVVAIGPESQVKGLELAVQCAAMSLSEQAVLP